MTSEDIRTKFIDFFKKRDHAVIPSASLIPQNDPSVLFITAGMQPLIPYIMGKPHPLGKRIVNIQKCVRTQDIEEVGDATHDTFFEMLGNWSFGDYFKKEAITWSYEFLTDKKEGLGLDPSRLYITCFKGDDNAPKDEESFKIWTSLGIPKSRIYFLGKEDNWWSPGDNGPCGPDTEMFYDVTGNLNLKNVDEFKKANDDQKVIEVWNDVFMEYEKKDGKVIGKLEQKNVDTGAGLERLTMIIQNKDNIFDTDLFSNIMPLAKILSSKVKSQRIIADHLRTSVFLISDGVIPSNTDQGYVLRRLIRRAIINMETTDIDVIREIINKIVLKYKNFYKELEKADILQVILKEFNAFSNTLKQGVKEFNKISKKGSITAEEAFKLFSSYGLPIDAIRQLSDENKIKLDENGFYEYMEKHKELSRKGAEKRFKGGLSDTSDISKKYHTATHLLHQALKDVLGQNVNQMGSNITQERLRFDFSYPKKMTEEQKKAVEDIVNKKIKEGLPVTYEDVTKSEAQKRGAIGLFDEKYGDRVRIYKIGDYSLEYCGGPHVENTKELGLFKIKKEEAVSSGVRRIKAVLIQE